jgi:hypothetical protein
MLLFLRQGYKLHRVTSLHFNNIIYTTKYNKVLLLFIQQRYLFRPFYGPSCDHHEKAPGTEHPFFSYILVTLLIYLNFFYNLLYINIIKQDILNILHQ